MISCDTRIRRMSVAALIIATIADSTTCQKVLEPVLPRYKFQVGQELVYRVTETEDLLADKDKDEEKKRPDSESEWRVYVARQNEDGSWRLLVRRMFKSYSANKHGKPEIKFENDFLGYVDLHSDGTYATNDSLGSSPIFQLQPNELFFRLPHDLDTMSRGWEYGDSASGAHYAFKTAAPVDGVMALTAKLTTPEDANYESSEMHTYQFDLDRGLLLRDQRESKADWRVNPWHVRSAKELIDEKQHDAAWMTAFAEAAEEYLTADRRWWDAFEQCKRIRSQSECEELLNGVKAELQERLDDATIPEFKVLYAARLTLHKRDSKWAIDEVKEREELYARAPVDWETTDFDDNAQRLVDYRGKVVVMDFWYRGCGHCIKALPKIKQIAAKYADRQVAVLGINNDSDDSDARHVINTFELKYPMIRNGEISKSYGVSMWPTLIVLDQSGRVALFHSGNSDNLVDEVSRMVDHLLANPAESDATAGAAVNVP